MLFNSNTLSELILVGTAALPTLLSGTSACPFVRGGSGRVKEEIPEGHPDFTRPCPTQLRRKEKVSALIMDIASAKHGLRGGRKMAQNHRLLSAGGCITKSLYDNIAPDIQSISDAMADISDSRAKGHFFGGIVRLAAHDFMDYDVSDDTVPLGQDGCVDFNVTGTGKDNAGLEEIWCDDCPLTQLYETSYAPFGVGRADFWVASANAVIKLTSGSWTDSSSVEHDGLALPFRYGRIDRDDCTPAFGNINSAQRLPGAQHCDETERVFLTQMGLSWTDATALLGAHSLGFGHSEFSGHDGMWMDTLNETVIFDKRYYEEIIRRAWRKRNVAGVQDWTWAGDGALSGGDRLNPRFMLNVDLCLAFDIDELPDCCSRVRQGGNTPGEAFCLEPDPTRNITDFIGTITECSNSSVVRPESFEAVHEFAVSARDNENNNDNRAFYEAFYDAWQRATEAGYDEGSLHSLPETCPSLSPTSGPTGSPTGSPTQSPTSVPTVSPITTASPSKSPSVSPSKAPTGSPSESPSVAPTGSPSNSPSVSPSKAPTGSPSESPSVAPTGSPSNSPSGSPSKAPSGSGSPSNFPSVAPAGSPSNSPSGSPCKAPAGSPSNFPSATPTRSPILPGTCTGTEGAVMHTNDVETIEKTCTWVVERGKCHIYGEICPISCNPQCSWCANAESFVHTKENGETEERKCKWAANNGFCDLYGLEFCPVSCGKCEDLHATLFERE